MSKEFCQLCGAKLEIRDDVMAPDHPYCCEVHGFIPICAVCEENVRKIAPEHWNCLIEWYEKNKAFLEDFDNGYPKYGCLMCSYTSNNFNQTVKHMDEEKHFPLNSDGTPRMTYPILIKDAHQFILWQIHYQKSEEK